MEGDSDDEGMCITRDIIEHGMRTGNVNDPVLTQRLVDYIASTREKAKQAKPIFSSYREKDKRSKKSKRKKLPPVKGLPSDSTSSEGDEGGIMPMMNLASPSAPFTISSKVFKPYDDDTPVYIEKVEEVHISSEGETSDDRELIQRIKSLNVQSNEREEQTLIKEGLDELRLLLDSSEIPRNHYYDPVWRSAFFSSNETEVLTEEVLSQFIDEYSRETIM